MTADSATSGAPPLSGFLRLDSPNPAGSATKLGQFPILTLSRALKLTSSELYQQTASTICIGTSHLGHAHDWHDWTDPLRARSIVYFLRLHTSLGSVNSR
jgi:hypothetical protein